MSESVIPIEAELTLFRGQVAALHRRADRRYRCRLATPGKLHVLATGERLTAWLYNLSVGGIGLELPQPLTPGQDIMIHLRTISSNEAVHIGGRVAHCTPVADGSWRVGCQFNHKLSAEAMETLL